MTDPGYRFARLCPQGSVVWEKNDTILKHLLPLPSAPEPGLDVRSRGWATGTVPLPQRRGRQRAIQGQGGRRYGSGSHDIPPVCYHTVPEYMCVCFFAGEPAGRGDVVTGSSLCEGCPLIQHSIGFRPQGPDAPSLRPAHFRVKTTFQRVIGIDQVRKCDQLNCPLSVWIIVLSENVTSSIVSTVPGLLFPAPGVCGFVRQNSTRSLEEARGLPRASHPCICGREDTKKVGGRQKIPISLFL